MGIFWFLKGRTLDLTLDGMTGTTGLLIETCL